MKFSIMDVTGHSEEQYSAAEASAGLQRFKELLAQGKTAAVRSGARGEYEVTREFPKDTASEVLFIPQLQGG